MPRPTAHGHHHPGRPDCRRRLLGAVVVGGLVLAACGGDDGGESGLADVQGVARDYCSALGDLITSIGEADRTDSSFAPATGDTQALVEVIPDDAPDDVTVYFVALAEMTMLADVWENEVGGIKDEYIDDFQRLLGVVAGDPAASTAQYSREQCPDPGGFLTTFFGAEGASMAAPTGDESPPETATGEPAEVRTVLDDGPAGTYEHVTFDIATVTATNADPAITSAGDPIASDSAFLLVEIDATTDASAANQFNPDDFRLEDPSGTAVAAREFTDASGNATSVQLRGRDSMGGVLVFPTDSFVSDLDGYTFSIDRDDRVPTVLSMTDPNASPYPIELEAGATGALEVQATPACVDNYETSVTAVASDLDADLGDSSGVVRSTRGQRWIRVVLGVTNVTVQGDSSNDAVCQAFSGNFAAVELRLDADGRATAAANSPLFTSVEPGTVAERVLVFPVPAAARALVLVGPAGEELGRWTVDLPSVPGE